MSTDRSQDSGSGGLSEVSTTERSNERRNGSNYSDVRSNERGTGSNESSISGSTERQDRDQNKEEFRIESNTANDSNLQQVMRNSENVGGGSIGSRISENDGGASNNSLQNEYSNSNNGSRIVQSDGITTHLSNRNDGSLSGDARRPDVVDTVTSSDLGGFNTETYIETKEGAGHRGDVGRSRLSEQSGERFSDTVEQLGDSTNGRTIQESWDRVVETIRDRPLSGDNRGNRGGSLFNERGKLVIYEDRVSAQKSSEKNTENVGGRGNSEGIFDKAPESSRTDVSNSSSSTEERVITGRTGEISDNERVDGERKSSLFSDLYANN